MMRRFSLRSQNSEYPRIFQVTGANQNVQKLLSTDLVNTTTTNYYYTIIIITQIVKSYLLFQWIKLIITLLNFYFNNSNPMFDHIRSIIDSRLPAPK